MGLLFSFFSAIQRYAVKNSILFTYAMFSCIFTFYHKNIDMVFTRKCGKYNFLGTHTQTHVEKFEELCAVKLLLFEPFYHTPRNLSNTLDEIGKRK